jgi:hypothetical protein
MKLLQLVTSAPKVFVETAHLFPKEPMSNPVPMFAVYSGQAKLSH